MSQSLNIKQLIGLRLGQYHLIDLIGEGGMSAVYRGYQENLDREVAVKVLSEERLRESGNMQRFAQEARTSAGLEHANIIPVHDYGTQDGVSYVVMRLLKGGTLTERLRYIRAHRRPLPSLKEASEFLDRVADALGYAHSRGVIHRDIKSSNVMFSVQGNPFIVDFGIAHLIHSDSYDDANTVVGTPTYMAPEQWNGEPLTPAVDQYALGILMYQMLSGRLPFDAESPIELMEMHLNNMPEEIHKVRDTIPENISPIIDRAMAKKPQDRFGSVERFNKVFSLAVGERMDKPTDFFTVALPNSISYSKEVDKLRFQSEAASRPSTQNRGERLKTRRSAAAIPPPPDEVDDTQAPQALVNAPPTIPKSAAVSIPRNNLITVEESPRRRLPIWAFIVIVTILVILGYFFTTNASPSALPSVTDEPEPTDIVVAIPVPTEIAMTTAEATSLPTRVSTGLIVQPSKSAVVEDEIIEGADIDLKVSDPQALEQLNVLFDQAQTPARAVAFGQDDMLASAHGDGVIRLWQELEDEPQIISGHGGVVYGIAFSPDGRLFASGGEDNTVRVWEVDTGDSLLILTEHRSKVRDVVFSPDGELVASASEDTTIRVWELETGTEQHILSPDSRVLTVAFHPDGKTLASGDEAGVIHFWNSETGEEILSIPAHSESIRKVVFSPDGRWLASSSTDNTIKIWEVETNQEVYRLTSHEQDVWFVTFSPDNQYIASGGRDNMIRIWDVESGEELVTLGEHSGWVFGLAYTADGASLASASGDGTIRLWGVPES